MLADIPAAGSGELLGAAFDRLLLRPDSQRRHPSALQRQDTPVTDHRLRDLECVLGGHLAGGLLEHDCPQVLRVEHRVMLDQSCLDAILDRPLGLRALGAGEELQRLPRAEPVLTARLAPHPLQVASGREGLRSPVLQREVA